MVHYKYKWYVHIERIAIFTIMEGYIEAAVTIMIDYQLNSLGDENQSRS